MRQEHTRSTGWMLAGGALVALGYAIGNSGAGVREAAAQQQPPAVERSRPQSMISVESGGHGLIVDHANFAYVVSADGKAVRVYHDQGRNEYLRIR